MKIFELIRLFKVKNGRSPTPGELDQLKVLSQQQEMNKNELALEAVQGRPVGIGPT